MTKAELAKALKATPEGVLCAVVTGHTVVQRRGGGGPKLTQSAAKILVTGFSPDGEPVPDDQQYNSRLKSRYKQRTVVGVLREDTYEYDPISGRIGSTVYFEPRRVLLAWKDYEDYKREEVALREESLRRSKAESVVNKQRRATLRQRCRDLGLPRFGWTGNDPMFDHSAYPDGSGKLEFNGDYDGVIALLDRLERAEADLARERALARGGVI